MTHKQLSKHVGHDLTVGVVMNDEGPTGLSLDCHTCKAVIESVSKPEVECVLCGGPVEPWPTMGTEEPGGWGHNPDPLGTPEGRACDNCNATKVIPARLGVTP